MTRWLETDSLSNQDISSALAIGAYTADADRMILVQFFADQVAGNGDYEFYVTLRVNGAGSSYRLIPITTAAAASGLTAIGGQSGMIAVRSGDVVTVYLDGLAGDNSTPDTTVRWFEMAALRPTIADRTLDVSAGGEAGVDWGNVGSPTTTVNLSGTSTKANETAPMDAAGTRGALGMAAADLDAQLDALPTAAETATATRSELAVELAHLDDDVSSRAVAGDAMTLADDAIDNDSVSAEFFNTVSSLVEDAVGGAWDAQGEDHTDDGSFGLIVQQIVAAGSGLTAQQTRDAMKLAPSAGAPAAGSVDAHLDAIQAQTDTIDDIKAVTDALDISAVTHVTVNDAGVLTITRTLSFSTTLSGLDIPADWEACYWTVKRTTDDLDADALVQILVSNPGDADDGVQVLMGVALTDESDGSLTVNQALGTVTIALGDASTALLEDAVELVWDVKFHFPAGKTQPGTGTATITTAVTRA